MTALTGPERRESNRFDMRGGPLDGTMVRVFRPDWTVLDLPEWGGMYVRPQDVDPTQRSSKPNKRRSNVPHMLWEAYA